MSYADIRPRHSPLPPPVKSALAILWATRPGTSTRNKTLSRAHVRRSGAIFSFSIARFGPHGSFRCPFRPETKSRPKNVLSQRGFETDNREIFRLVECQRSKKRRAKRSRSRSPLAAPETNIADF